jgi:hypothetical protein
MPEVALLLRHAPFVEAESEELDRTGAAGDEGANDMNRTSIALAVLLVIATSLAAADTVPPGDPKTYETVVGCLERSPTGDFILRSTAEEIPLQEAGGMDKHLGRTVRVTGRWQSGTAGRRLRVAKIEYVAEGCG